MDDLLTTRQVQDYLKVDRITIYRMLQDGRLKAVKIGQQWRFPLAEVQRLVEVSPTSGNSSPVSLENGQPSFPTHCVQLIQTMFSEMGQVASLVVDPSGIPLTQVVGDCAFCQLIQSSPSGMSACQQTWREVAESARMQASYPSGWHTCHAGLQYLATPILENGALAAVLLTGQCYTLLPDPEEQILSIEALAYRHQLDPRRLVEAARSIPIPTPDRYKNLLDWRFSFSRTIESILSERSGFVDRLQQIARLSQLTP
jgi:excisionase family DNA binding protein